MDPGPPGPPWTPCPSLPIRARPAHRTPERTHRTDSPECAIGQGRPPAPLTPWGLPAPVFALCSCFPTLTVLLRIMFSHRPDLHGSQRLCRAYCNYTTFGSLVFCPAGPAGGPVQFVRRFALLVRRNFKQKALWWKPVGGPAVGPAGGPAGGRFDVLLHKNSKNEKNLSCTR